jgi:nitrogen fixation/metabolism regulation signal transduction histidine kinase
MLLTTKHNKNIIRKAINNWSPYYEAVLESLTCGQIVAEKIKCIFVKEVIKMFVSRRSRPVGYQLS